jgi:peptide/nickel transport system substrate-binding protein
MRVLLAVAALACALDVHGVTLRWATQGDPQTMDPYSQNENLTNNVNGQIYETLLHRDHQLNIRPVLATSYEQRGPLTWRFKLRPNVKFHDGTPMTADDVVFSVERAQQPTSQIRTYANAMGTPKKIDDLTVEFVQKEPNPIMLEHATLVQIMSRAWCMKNKVEKPQDFKNREETYAARNANGTGPYMLKSREPDIKTVMSRNPNWWGIAEKRFEGNVDELVYLPIKSDATRVAALLSGEVDLVSDPPTQDIARLKQTPQVKVLEGVENRVVFIGMDQARDELLYSNVKGKNPLKDKRVRQALYQAIDIEALRTRTMRGLALPTGAILPSPKFSNTEAEKRLPFDIAKAKQLMAEAGYPNGFEVTLDCPNNRYINDEAICQALAGMWAKIGVSLKVNAMPKTVYFPKIEKLDTSMYMLGWGGAVTDPQTIFTPVWHSRKPPDGDYNYGNYSDARLDALIDAAKQEMDTEKRKAIIRDALAQESAEIRYIPLHRQVIPWAARSNVKAVHRADNWVEAAWVTVESSK